MKMMMRSVCLSPHLSTFCESLSKRIESFKFVYKTDDQGSMRRIVGWNSKAMYDAVLDSEDLRKQAETVDVLFDNLREIELIEKRCKNGLLTFYAGERWFKPPFGFARIFHPKYFSMLKRFFKCVHSGYLFLLPMGVHAARDFARIDGLLKGDLRCLFRSPKITFESKPGGLIRIKGKICSYMRIWGYFVDVSETPVPRSDEDVNETDAKKSLKVLWVGRMLDWKRVDTLIKACRTLDHVSLSIYGQGPEERRLKALASGAKNITFNGYVLNSEVRRLMHTHDVYVMPSNGSEGWGAVISEALSEGMKVIGTYEAGSTATILPSTNLFKAGDVKGLQKLLSCQIPSVSIGDWSGSFAAESFMELVKE